MFITLYYVIAQLEKPGMNKGKGIQSVERACAILEAVALKKEIGVTELSKTLGLHVATIHNFVRTLTTLNYLINAGGRYRLGPAVPALSAQWDPALVLPAMLKPYVEDIVRKTGESAAATILTGSHAETIVDVQGDHDITVQFPRKTWPYPFILATGRVLVAFQPKDTWNDFIRRHIDGGCGNGSGEKWSRKKWCRELDRIAANEIAIIRRPGPDAASAIGAPVWGVNKKTVMAALGVSCPSFRLTGKHIARLKKALLEATRQASQFLQGKSPPDEFRTITQPERKKR